MPGCECIKQISLLRKICLEIPSHCALNKKAVWWGDTNETNLACILTLSILYFVCSLVWSLMTLRCGQAYAEMQDRLLVNQFCVYFLMTVRSINSRFVVLIRFCLRFKPSSLTDSLDCLIRFYGSFFRSIFSVPNHVKRMTSCARS